MKEYILTYPIGDRLYLNITNRCTNSCAFCIRKSQRGVGYNLWLCQEPDFNDLIKAVGDPGKYSELVFCGYGEPLLRMDLVRDVAGYIRNRFDSKIRVITNGHADMVHGPGSAARLEGLVDRINISLNAQNAELYRDICRPAFGPGTYEAVIQFARSCVGVIPDITLSVVQWPGVDIEKCRKIARDLGVSFRVRKLDGMGRA